MTLILPGVEIQVVKEIVAGQLNPSGILGLIGITEENEDIHDAEQWLWEEKQKLTQATRNLDELENTLKAVEEECDRIGYKD